MTFASDMKKSLLLLLAFLSFLAYSNECLLISGGKSKKYSTPGKALSKAKSGDTVIIGNGVWEGGLKINVPDLTVKGKERTVIFAGRKISSAAWQKAPEAGKNAWKTVTKMVPDTVVCNGRALIELHPSNGKGAYSYREIMKYGIGSTGRVLLGGIFSYDRKTKTLTVSLPDCEDISKCSIYVSGRGKDAVTVQADNCKISDLTVVGGEGGVAFRKAKNSEVSRVLALANKNGILFTDGSSGCSAHHCDVILNGDHVLCNAAWGPMSAAWDVWLAYKRVGSWDKTGIAIFWAGKGNKIYSNTVYNHWNGIHCGTNPKTWNRGLKEYYQNNISCQKGRVNQETEVFNNRIDLCFDDALEPAGDVQNHKWYSNKVTRAHCGLRIKTIDIGPLYLFDNDISDCLDGIRFFKTVTEPAQVYVVHNKLQHSFAHTFAGVEAAPLKGTLGKKVPGGVRGGHMHNNLYITESYSKTFPKPGTPMFSASNNAYMCKRPAEISKDLESESRFELKLDAKDDVCKSVKAKKLSTAELPAEKQGEFAGLLGLDKEATPKTFVSGRYEETSKMFDFSAKDWKDIPLYVRRFVRGAKQNYVIESKNALNNTKILIRAYLRTQMKPVDFKVVFSDDKGVIAEKSMKFLAVQELEIPAQERRKVIMSVVSPQKDAAWCVENITPEISCRLLLNEPVEIIAGNDISAIEITTEVSAQDKSIGIAVESLFEQKKPFVWITPDGKSLELPKNGIINTAGKTGTWKLAGGNCRRIRISPVKGCKAPELEVLKVDASKELKIRPAPAGFPN